MISAKISSWRELFGRRYTMVSVHHIVFILDLVESYRRERTTFSHGHFDPLQPFRGDMRFQSKTVVEILIAPDTAHDPIDRYSSNTRTRLSKAASSC